MINDAWPGQYVGDLVGADGGWNEEVMQEFFTERDRVQIRKVRPPVEGKRDERIWSHSKRGDYTVRSAYHFFMENMGQTGHLREEGEWKKLWALKLPPKVKHFAWRAARGILPCRETLRNHHIEVPDMCVGCGIASENLWHMYLLCDLARDCWVAAGVDDVVDEIRGQSANFHEWWWNLLRYVGGEICQKIVTIMWALWRERNNRVWKSEMSNPEEVVRMGLESVEDWRKARGITSIIREGSNQQCERWHPPSPGTLKCNVDVATFPDINAYGVGMILRNHRGEMLAFKYMQVVGMVNAREGEIKAMLEAIRWVIDRREEKVVLETDCLEVVNNVWKGEEDVTEFGEVVHQCRRLLADKPEFTVVFVKRRGNLIAHNLARQSRFSASPVIGEVPLEWFHNVLNDYCDEH